MNLYQQANKVRNAGASYSPGDTELIHATPEEKAILKLLGGSGRIDPVTGLPHFDAGGKRGDTSAGEASGGYGGDGDSGSDNDDSGSDNDDSGFDPYSGTEGWGDDWNNPESEAYARGATPGYGESVASKTKGGNWVLGGAGLLGGTALFGPKAGLSLGKSGWNIGKGSTVSSLGNTAGWNSIDGKAVSSNTGTTSDGIKGNGGSYWASLPTGTTGNLGGTTGTGTTTGTTGTTTTGSSIFPSIYTDPVTGRILNTAAASSNSNQQLLDQIMGTSLASTPLANASSNPLLQQINSGLMARVGNENIDNTVANTMKANENVMARRGMGMLASPLQDQVRASLGLSTAQARNANNLAAQESNWKKQADLLSFLKTGQTADTVTQLGLADLENQREIAEITAALQEKLANKNLSYLKGVQDQNNTNSWINTAGDVLGSIDWGSLFS